MAYVEIGCTPGDEDCAQTPGTEGYQRLQKMECEAYIEALKRVYGPPPEGSRFRIFGNPHDSGTYYEVQFVYNESDFAQLKYARLVENGLSRWEEAHMNAPVEYDRKSQPTLVRDRNLWFWDTQPEPRR